MVHARLYRPDLITGEYTQQVGYAVIGRGGVDHMHTLATQACMRNPEAYAYALYEGTTLHSAKAISLVHVVRQKD